MYLQNKQNIGNYSQIIFYRFIYIANMRFSRYKSFDQVLNLSAILYYRSDFTSNEEEIIIWKEKREREKYFP